MFLRSNPNIYATMKFEGIAQQWHESDYIMFFSGLTNTGNWYWDPMDERLKQGGVRQLTGDTPWCHAKNTFHKHCGLDHSIIFNNFNIIPPRCQECWKVTVTPNTVNQLFQLEQLQRLQNVPCKCGIEIRDYTPKFYGGYYYTNSLDEGRERWEQVRKDINDNIEDGKDIDVILKRGCTEMEMIKGSALFWHTTDEEAHICEMVEGFVDGPRDNTQQSELLKTHVKMKWLLWAHMNGDFTYLPYNNNKRLFPDYMKFHQHDINDLKRELALGRAVAKGGMKKEDAEDFLEQSQIFAKAKGIEDLSVLATAFGEMEKNPLKMSEYRPIYDTPGHLKGDHEELT
jgi:hypothetical protein